MRFGQSVGPVGLAYHIGLLINDNTMLIATGNRHVHYSDETCFSPLLYAYDITCGTWTPAIHHVNPVINSTFVRARSAAAGNYNMSLMSPS